MEALEKKAVLRPWAPAALDSEVTASCLIEEHMRSVLLKNIARKDKCSCELEIDHLEVNGASPSTASIKVFYRYRLKVYTQVAFD